MSVAIYEASIQGRRGSNSEIAARILLRNPSPNILYCDTSEETFEAVIKGLVDQAVIAMENTLAGPVNVSLDLLYQHKLYINAETEIRIQFALVAPPGVQIDDLRQVFSHPMAFPQCQIFLRKYPAIKQVPEFDTAGAVEKVIAAELRDAAGIAGPWTAELFGGVVLADHIEDNSENYTRFFLVSREPRFPSNIHSYKVSVVFLLPDEPGALHNAIRPFAERRINLSNIEKRPIPGEPFKYRFYLDLTRDPGQGPAMDEALTELERLSTSMRVLGKFPVHDRKE